MDRRQFITATTAAAAIAMIGVLRGLSRRRRPAATDARE